MHAVKAGGSRPLAVDTRKFALDSLPWKEYLQGEDEPVVEELRLKAQRGRVPGRRGFVKRSEQKPQRSRACLNPGRLKKARQ